MAVKNKDGSPSLMSLLHSCEISFQFTELQSCISALCRAKRLLDVVALLTQAQHYLQVMKNSVEKRLCFISMLPGVLQCLCGEYMSLKELLRMECVNKSWRLALESADSNQAWRLAYVKQPWSLEQNFPDQKGQWRDYVKSRVTLERNWIRGHFQSQQLHCGAKLQALSMTDDCLVIGSVESQISVWDRGNRSCQRKLYGHTNGVLSLATSTNLIASGSADSKIKIWHLETGYCMATLTGHSNPVSSVFLAADNDLLFSSSYDRSVKAWDISTGVCLNTFRSHTQAIHQVHGHGKIIASGSADRTVRETALDSGLVVRTLVGHSGPVSSVHVDDQGTVSGSGDTTIRIWKNGALQSILTGHNNAVRCLKVKGNLLVSGSSDNTVRIWRAWDSTSRSLLHKADVIAVDLDSQTLVSGDIFGRVIFRDFMPSKA